MRAWAGRRGRCGPAAVQAASFCVLCIVFWKDSTNRGRRKGGNPPSSSPPTAGKTMADKMAGRKVPAVSPDLRVGVNFQWLAGRRCWRCLIHRYTMRQAVAGAEDVVIIGLTPVTGFLTQRRRERRGWLLRVASLRGRCDTRVLRSGAVGGARGSLKWCDGET
jgi:hypothetical protein